MQDEEDHLYAIRIHNSSTKIDYDNRKNHITVLLRKRLLQYMPKRQQLMKGEKKSQTEYGRISRVRFELAQKVFQLNKLMPAATF